MALQRALTSADRDLSSERAEFVFRLPAVVSRQLSALLKDARDEPLAICLANICSFLPLTLCTCCISSHWLGAAHFTVLYALYLQRFMLALHYSQHRPIFKRGSSLNQLLPGALTPLFGLPIGSYHAHHCLMHHREDNHHPKDISSTEPYQRNNVGHFLLYWLRFVVAIWFELPRYAWRAGSKRRAASLSLSLLGYWVSICLSWRFNQPATLWVLIIPFFVTSLALMFGNWCQHMFIDQDRPDSVWASTYNCIGCSDNQKSFNDGYHIVHHVTPGLHWSELPTQFKGMLPDHRMHKALLFDGIGFFEDLTVSPLLQPVDPAAYA
ncbi:hypothetical protein WJX74_004078 [Apatococcus lobatus]|uniref:Fatty acid desaturase domain-containing protein n=2 Tax=Apatococcus TaxID=904362 RepID=A0AAW1R0W9_9CHLO